MVQVKHIGLIHRIIRKDYTDDTLSTFVGYSVAPVICMDDNDKYSEQEFS